MTLVYLIVSYDEEKGLYIREKFYDRDAAVDSLMNGEILIEGFEK
jgi:hypothetical protein